MMKKIVILLLIYLVFDVHYSVSQVLIKKNTNSNTKAIIDFSTSKKGIVFPHLNATQRKNINNSQNCPKKGIIGYDTIEKKIYTLINPIINNIIIPDKNKKDSCGCWVSFKNIDEFLVFKSQTITKINNLKTKAQNTLNKLNFYTQTTEWIKIGDYGNSNVSINGQFNKNWQNTYSGKNNLVVRKDNLNKLYINGYIKFYNDDKIEKAFVDDTIFQLPNSLKPSKSVCFRMDRINKNFHYIPWNPYHCRYHFNDNSPWCEITTDGYCIVKNWEVFKTYKYSEILNIPEYLLFIIDNVHVEIK